MDPNLISQCGMMVAYVLKVCNIETTEFSRCCDQKFNAEISHKSNKQTANQITWGGDKTAIVIFCIHFGNKQ